MLVLGIVTENGVDEIGDRTDGRRPIADGGNTFLQYSELDKFLALGEAASFCAMPWP